VRGIAEGLMRNGARRGGHAVLSLLRGEWGKCALEKAKHLLGKSVSATA